NHYAALLYMALPLTVGWAYGLYEDRDRSNHSVVLIVLSILLLVIVIVGLVLARSRGGLILVMLGLMGSFILVWKSAQRSRFVLRGLSIAAIISVLIGLQFGLYGVLERLDTGPAEDARWDFAQATLRAADYFRPFGSGFGTFENV